jgi:hypothetical protein
LAPVCQLDSLAGIVETDAPPIKADRSSIKKSDITLDDLPQDIRSQFNTIFKPQFLRSLESSPASTGVDSWEKLAPTWDRTFPKYPLAKHKTFDPHRGQILRHLS